MMRRQRAGVGPGPYGTSVIVPQELRTSPFVFVRSHAWPKQDLAEFQAAVENERQHEIAANAIFMPRAAYMHPYSSPSGGPTAISRSQTNMAAMQQHVMQKYANGVPLTKYEATIALALCAPTRVNYQAIARAQARAAGVPALTARQLPAYVVNCLPPMVAAKRMALMLPFGRMIPQRSVISRTNVAAERASAQVRGRAKGVL